MEVYSILSRNHLDMEKDFYPYEEDESEFISILNMKKINPRTPTTAKGSNDDPGRGIRPFLMLFWLISDNPKV